MNNSPVLAVLGSNLAAPSVKHAFRDGVEAAMDRLSIPVELSAATLREAPTNSLQYEVLCVVVLVAIGGDEGEAAKIIGNAIEESRLHEKCGVLLVAIPSSTICGDLYFRSNFPASALEGLSLDGVPTLDDFTKVVEYHITEVVHAHLPAADTLDKAQDAALDESVSQSTGPAPIKYVLLPGRLS